MITSRRNPKIKQIRKLNSSSKYRAEAGLFVVEGIRSLEEALHSGINPEWVIYTQDLDQRGISLVDNFRERHVACDPVSIEVLEAASDTKTPQGVLGVFSLLSIPLPPSPSLVVILDSLRDPGNLGTLMRTCLAAEVDGLLLSPETVDPFSPKVVRAAMGAHFKLAIHVADWSAISDLTQDIPLLLAEMESEASLWEMDLTKPLGIILGNEAHGISDQARSLAAQSTHIPINSKVESLNVAAAGAILLFEVRRQRSKIG
jgi:TrmH family RNA methyltransferase